MTTLNIVLLVLLGLSVFYNYRCLTSKRSRKGGGDPDKGKIDFTGLVSLRYALYLIKNYRSRRESHTNLLPENTKERIKIHTVFLLV